MEKLKGVRTLTLICLTLTVLLAISCHENLYFDSAPPINEHKDLSKEIQKLKKYIGVYQLNFKDLKNVKVDVYKEDKYINYQRPVLGKTTDDSLSYFAKILFVNKYLEIYESKGKINFLGFDCVDKKIFSEFFLNKTRTIKDKNSWTSFTVSLLNDTLKLKLHQLDTITNITNDTIYRFKYWTRDSLICITNQKQESFFPNSIDIKKIDYNALNYITLFKNEFFLVQRDTSVGKTKFQISNLRPDKTGFVFSTITDHYELNDTVLQRLGLKLIDDKVIEYKESRLLDIFKSELAEDIFKARQIIGFPSLTQERNLSSKLLKNPYFILTGLILLVLILILIIKAKKRVESTSP
jgi:hypothetical protein